MTIMISLNAVITAFLKKLLILIVVVILFSVTEVTKITNAKPLANPAMPQKLQKMLTEKSCNKENLAVLKKQYKGQHWLLVLWSVDCPPCLKELALIQTISEQVANLPIVIVNADDCDDISYERKSVIERFKLSHLTHLYFVEDQGAKSRYILDPS